jgi:hypothetical protein
MSIKFPASMFDVLVLVLIVVFTIIVIVLVVVVMVVIVMIETYTSTIVPIAIVVGRTPLLGHPGKPFPNPKTIRTRTGIPPLVHIQITVGEPLSTSDLVLVLDLSPDPILATLLPLSLVSPRLDVPPPTPSTLGENALGPRPLTLPTGRGLGSVDVPEVAFRLVATTIQAGSVGTTSGAGDWWCCRCCYGCGWGWWWCCRCGCGFRGWIGIVWVGHGGGPILGRLILLVLLLVRSGSVRYVAVRC